MYDSGCRVEVNPTGAVGVGDASVAPEGAALLPGLSRHVGHLLWRSRARVQVALAEVLPRGVDLTAYAALLVLADGRARSQQELADLVRVSRTTMASVADRLAEQALVTRERNPEDRRSYVLVRTPAGERAAGGWHAHVAALEDRLTAGFSAAERGELRDLLRRGLDDEVDPAAPDVLRLSTGFLVTRLSMRMHADFAAGLEPLGVEPRHFGALAALSELGPVGQSTLARHLGVSGPTVVVMVDELEARGLVRRERDPADRRTSVLHLTAPAAALLPRAKRIAQRRARRGLAPIGPEGADRLVVLLRRFVTAP